MLTGWFTLLLYLPGSVWQINSTPSRRKGICEWVGLTVAGGPLTALKASAGERPSSSGVLSWEAGAKGHRWLTFLANTVAVGAGGEGLDWIQRSDMTLSSAPPPTPPTAGDAVPSALAPPPLWCGSLENAARSRTVLYAGTDLTENRYPRRVRSQPLIGLWLKQVAPLFLSTVTIHTCGCSHSLPVALKPPSRSHEVATPPWKPLTRNSTSDDCQSFREQDPYMVTFCCLLYIPPH